MDESDILIIGGGVIGLFSALYLLEKGLKVSIVDSGPIPGQQAASFGNAGIVAQFPSNDFFRSRLKLDKEYFRWLWKYKQAHRSNNNHHLEKLITHLSQQSLELFQDIQNNHDVELFMKLSGIQKVCKSTKSFEQEIGWAKKAKQYGINSEIWDNEVLSSKNPGLKPRVSGAVYYPNTGILDPYPLQKTLVDFLESKEVKIFPDTRITSFIIDSNKIIGAASGRKSFNAKNILIAGGAHSVKIAQIAKLHIPLQTGKGISYQVRKSGIVPAFPTLLQDSGIGITPYKYHIRVTNRTTLGDTSTNLPLPELLKMNNIIKEFFEGWEISRPKKRNAWFGQISISPDGLPVIGRSNSYENLLIAAGHSRFGLSLAPITGKIISEMIAGQTILTSHDAALLDPGRFGNKF